MIKDKDESLCEIDLNGIKIWKNKQGKYHRLDGPAVEHKDWAKHWFIDGKRHRIDGPAIEHWNGSKCWYLYGIELPKEEFDYWSKDLNEEKEIMFKYLWMKGIHRMAYQTLDVNNHSDHTKSLLFLDPNGTTTVARFDKIKYRVFDRLVEEQLGFFWRPSEVDLTRDSKDFRSLTTHEQHIFTSNLKRQTLLDSVQGRAPNQAFLPLCSLPELEIWLQTWTFNETIHSKSYTHIIQNVYSDPSIIFDQLLDIKEIVDCAKDITRDYDNLINYSNLYNVLGFGKHVVNGEEIIVSKRELKRRIWLALNAVNALEGIRFYVSFACSWAFAELKKMEGNAKIIKFICRDENLHLGSTQTLIKLLPKDDPEFLEISKECQDEVLRLFVSAVEQEKIWADYLFKDGSMIGLNASLLKDYVDFIAAQRLDGIGVKGPYKSKGNPLPWTTKWISGKEVQPAPQEVEISSYKIGDAKMDVGEDSFKGFKL